MVKSNYPHSITLLLGQILLTQPGGVFKDQVIAGGTKDLKLSLVFLGLNKWLLVAFPK